MDPRDATPERVTWFVVVLVAVVLVIGVLRFVNTVQDAGPRNPCDEAGASHAEGVCPGR